MMYLSRNIAQKGFCSLLVQVNRNGFVRFLSQKKENEEKKQKFSFNDAETKNIILAKELFDRKDKSKETFLAVVEAYSDRSNKTTRLGQCEFIQGALKALKEYGLHEDIEAYKKLMNVMPKERMVAKNAFQQLGFFYGKHQETAVDVLENMERNRVMPDKEMQELLISIFGERSAPYRKFARQVYWFGKLKKMSPFPLPEKMPNDALELAKILLKRICPDLQTKIQVYSTEVIADCIDKTWIVTAQSPVQREIIKQLDEPLYVEGPFTCMLNGNLITYFILKTLCNEIKPEVEDEYPFDVSSLKMSLYGNHNINNPNEKLKKIHIQSDGTILAVACTGTSSRDSLLSWIRILEHFDPNLKRLRILFKLKAPPKSELVKADYLNNENQLKKNTEQESS